MDINEADNGIIENEEEMVMNDSSIDDRSGDTLRAVFTGVGLGILVGLAIGILVAPKPGRETRTQLKEIAGTFGQKAKDLASGLGDTVVSTKEAVKRGVQATKDGFGEKKEELKGE